MLEDAELFARVQAADPAAWAEFVDRFGPAVQALARRAGLPAADADDVVQSTWTVLLRHAAALREPRSLPAWVLTTARREAWRVQRRRRQRIEAETQSGQSEVAAEDTDLDAESDRLERVQVVRDGLARMDGRCGALLAALFLEDPRPAYEDLSQRLGLPVGSIGPTRQRCLAKLARLLEAGGFRAESLS